MPLRPQTWRLGLPSFVLFALCASLFASLVGCKQLDQEVLISLDQIQATVGSKFPYDKNLIIARMILESPRVYFKGHNVGLRLKYSGSLAQKEAGGEVDFNGELEYRPDAGAFYLKNLEIVEITVNENTTVNKDSVKTAVRNIATNFLNEYPVYRLKSDSFKHDVAKAVLKKVHVQNDALVVTMGL